ncbi:carbohydrate porin [Serratia ureilytica]
MIDDDKKLSYLAITTGLFLSASSAAASGSGSIEARLNALEQRLAQAERRAAQAETRATAAERRAQQLEQRTANTERQTAQIAQRAATPETPVAPASALQLSGFNDLKLYGDVEFNLDGASRSGQLTSLKAATTRTGNPATKNVGISTAAFWSGWTATAAIRTATSPASACSRWRT